MDVFLVVYKQKELGMQAVKDFTAGVISGWVQVLIMQPFEIIKVRLQTQSLIDPEYKGIQDCLQKILKNEGFIALYKGTLSPLVGCGFQVSIQFGFNEMSKRFFSRFKENPTDILPLHLVACSGFVAGLGSGLLATPIQHARIRIQIQKNQATKIYNGSIEAAKKITQKHGLRGMYTGFAPTMIRQAIGSTLYFSGYEFFQRKFLQPGQTSKDANLSSTLISGGLAGLCYWGVVYPIDFVKTQIQSDNLQNRQFKGMFETVSKKVAKGGIRTLYNGYLVCLLRAFPVNAGGFLAFQAAMKVMGRSSQSE